MLNRKFTTFNFRTNHSRDVNNINMIKQICAYQLIIYFYRTLSVSILSLLLVTCTESILLDKLFIRNKLTKVLPTGWKLIEIKENQSPYHEKYTSVKGFKATIEGVNEEVELSYYGNDKSNYIREKRKVKPRYHVWFVPMEYKKMLKVGLEKTLEYEERLQSHRQFMHPDLILETNNFMVYGIYDYYGFNYLSEPKEFNWDNLTTVLIKEFGSVK